MSEKTNHLKIGLFVLAAVALLVAGLLAFGARSYFEPKFTFETFVEGSVDGLSVGSPVKLRGVPMGQVTRIGFTWNDYRGTTNTYITVEFKVEKSSAPVPMTAHDRTLEDATKAGLRAIVKSQGITGTSFVSLERLDPTRNPPPPIDFTPRHYYIPSAPSQFTKMLDSIEASLRSLQQLDFGAINNGVTNLLATVNRFGGNLEQLDLKTLVGNADALISDLKTAGGTLDSTLTDIRTNFALMNLSGIGTNANVLLLGLQDSNAKLQSVLDHLGTAPWGQTVDNLRQSLVTLNAVLLELKQYPAGFLLGKPPLPAHGVQPARR